MKNKIKGDKKDIVNKASFEAAGESNIYSR